MPVVGPPIITSGLGGTTVLDLVEETRRLVYGSSRPSVNRLPTTITDSASTITLEFDLKGAVQGALLEVDDELMWVVSSVGPSKTVTVVRGYFGTTPIGHDAETIVEVNPRFPRIYIKRALQQEIDSWGSRLFKVAASNISLSSTSRIYDLGVADFISVLDIRLSPFSGRTTRSNAYRWNLLRDMDELDFPSGSALQFPGTFPSDGKARVKVAQKFDVITEWEDTTIVEDLGLTSSMLDIPPVGAAWRLMSAKEVGRTDMTSQPEPRRSEEVPAGHMASVAAQLKKLRDDRIEEERWTQMQRYPLKGVA